LVTIDTDRTKAVVGRLGGRTIELDGLTVRVPETATGSAGGKSGSDGVTFAALSFTGMDGRPLAESGRILITAVGRVENTGMGWNAEHTSVSDQWGSAPTIAEGIAAQVTLRSARAGLSLHPLDGRGQPREGKVVQAGSGMVAFSLDPEQRTLWYILSAP